MKSQTHYQVKTQTAGQVANKKQQYLPHKWRGNTLVPVIIALAISAIATVAFLNQGADLTEKNKIILAQNEIASALSDWVVSREATGGANAATTATQPANRGIITFGALGAVIAANTAPFGNASAIVASTRYLSFPTSSAGSCTSLSDRFTRNAGIDGVGEVYCINNTDPEAANLAAGNILVIMLD